MSKTKEVTVGGNDFRIRRIPAFEAMELLGDVQKKLFTPFLAVLDGTPADDEAKFTAQISNGLGRVLGGLDGKQFVALAEQMLKPDYVLIVTEQGKDAEKLTKARVDQFDVTVTDLLELCVEVFLHNYADFLARAKARFGPALARLAPQKLAAATLN